jgi:hypothetical protein
MIFLGLTFGKEVGRPITGAANLLRIVLKIELIWVSGLTRRKNDAKIQLVHRRGNVGL